MASINAATAGGGGVITTSDASGNLNIQSGGSTVVAVTSTGVAVTGTLAATGTTNLGALTTTGNTILGDASTDTLNVGNGGLVKDASGNVGIGTASPTGKFNVGSGRSFFGANSETYSIGVGYTQARVNAGHTYYVGATDSALPDLVFSNAAGTERMRIDTSGNLLVGTTGISVGTFPGIQGVSASGGTGTFLSHSTSGTATRQWGFGHNNSDQFVVYGYNNTTFNTGAYIAWGATSWTASSDERKKDIIEPITDAIDKVSTLRAVIGKYKTDEEGTRRSFLIAQDVLAVLPEAVDATNPDDLGVQYTEVIPLLVAAIKEQQALIIQLQADVAALKALSV